MPNSYLRSAVVCMLLLVGCAVLVPYFSQLFSPAEVAIPTRPALQVTPEFAAAKHERAISSTAPTIARTSFEESHEEPEGGLAFGYQEEAPPTREYEPTARPEFQNSLPVPPPSGMSKSQSNLTELQSELEDLGAVHLVVERIEEGRFECRTLLPLSSQSTYQKSFSAQATTPQASMQQVIAEVRAWRASTLKQ